MSFSAPDDAGHLQHPGLSKAPADTHDVGRAVLLATVGIVGLQLRPTRFEITMALVLTGLLILCVLAVVGPLSRARARGVWADSSAVARILATLCLVSPVSEILHAPIGGPGVVAIALALAMVVGAGVAIWVPRGKAAAVAFGAFCAAWAVSATLRIRSTVLPDDVLVYLEGATRDLFRGTFPYGGSVPNPYPPEVSHLFLAPELVEGDRILIGFPYLPGALFSDVPGSLLGDPRFSHVAALVLAALILWRLAVDIPGRALAVLLLCSPLTSAVIVRGWIEPVVVLALALLALALVRGHRLGGAAALAFLLFSKQYVVAFLPVVISVGRRLGVRTVLLGGVVAAAVVAGFFAWGPGAFWHDVVQTQTWQPYRSDSVSLVVALGNRYGVPPAWLLNVLPFAGGLVASGLVSWRGRGGSTTAAAAVGLGLFATVLVSKQAFVNYYSLVQAALIIALVTWPIDGPSAENDPRAQQVDARR